MADQLLLLELRFTHLVLNALLYWVLFVAEANEWWQKAQGDVKRTLDFPFKNQQRAKNVIFFLGDGMGQNTVPYIFCWPLLFLTHQCFSHTVWIPQYVWMMSSWARRAPWRLMIRASGPERRRCSSIRSFTPATRRFVKRTNIPNVVQCRL